MENYYRKSVDFDYQRELNFHAIEWVTSDESFDEEAPDEYIIRAFGVTVEGYNVCCSIRNFKPYFYIKVPEYWTSAHFKIWLQKIQNLKKNGKSLINYYIKNTLLLNECKIEHHIPYYGFCNMEKSRFVRMVFSSQKGMKGYMYALKSLVDAGGDTNKLYMQLYDTNMDPLLKFFHLNGIQPSNHIKVDKFYKDDSSRCQIDVECDYTNVLPDIKQTNYPFLQASYDIETYSTPETKEGREFYPFPIPENKDNPVYQIATTFKKLGDPDFLVKNLLTLKTCSKIRDENIVVIECKDEKDLLLKWIQLIKNMGPDIIYSYNGNMFDDNYIWVRCGLLGIQKELGTISKLKDYQAKIIKATFSSSAYGTSEYKRLDIPGTINYDILITIRRDFKENSYKLDSISEKYLGEKKNPVSVVEIFKAYESGDPDKIRTIGNYCFVEGTRVSLDDMAVDIKCLRELDTNVITWYDKKGFSSSEKTHFFDNGKMECLELFLLDGTSIKCTKNHKFLTNDGYVEAQNIKKNHKLICYPEPPLVDFQKESGEGYKFSDMIGFLEYKKACILCRILGYLITDGSIVDDVTYKNYKSGRVKYIYEKSIIHLGTKIDANSIRKDIFTLTGKNVKFRKSKYTYIIVLPVILTKWFLSIKGVEKGKKINSEILLPAFLKNIDCPLWVSREFIRGLMGGDGHTTCYTRHGDKFKNLAFSQSKDIKNIESLISYMEDIKKILKKFDINSRVMKNVKNGCGVGYTVKLNIDTKDTVKYYEKIGFAYCHGKTFKLSVVSSYIKMKNSINNQRNAVFDRIKELQKKNNKEEAIILAHQEFKEKEIIFSEYSLTTDKYNSKFKKTGIFSPANFLKFLNVYDKFVSEEGKKSHAVSADSDYSDCFFSTVVGYKNIGLKNVYDIEVNKTNNFVANGVVVHNCVQDTRLPQLLVDKLHILQGQISMSNITYVTIKMLIERGQEVKALSQINLTSKSKGFLMPSMDYSGDTKGFEGATVLQPDVGLYDIVTVVDFEGLYPSIIRAHNLCFTSIVLENEYLNVPGIEYIEVKFSEDEPPAIFAQNTETVLPTLLLELYNERKRYKKLMKQAETPELKAIYDRNQLAVKVSANSIYGVLGSRTLGIREVAASVTFFGREMIKQTKEYIQNNHHSVYPEDCDSNVLDEDKHVTIKDKLGERKLKVKELLSIGDCLIKTDKGWREFFGLEKIV